MEDLQLWQIILTGINAMAMVTLVYLFFKIFVKTSK